MVDYNKLVLGVLDTIEEMKDYSLGKIEAILDDEKVFSEKEFEDWKRLTEGVCYDRNYCKRLGVDYNNLPSDDLKKIKVFALYLLINRYLWV